MRKFRLFLALVLGVTLFLSGCGQGRKNEIVDAPVDLTATGELSVYCQEENCRMVQGVAELYKMFYPEVELTVRTIPDQEYGTKVASELMAGAGADVVFLPWGAFPDLYKVMDSGALLNLTSVLEQDAEFATQEYNRAVLDAGVYRGGRYLVPVDYMVPTLITGKGLLENLGFPQKSLKDLTSITWEFQRLAPELKRPGFEAYSGKYLLLRHTGVQLLDREAGVALPEEEQAKDLAEFYKYVLLPWENGGGEEYFSSPEDYQQRVRDRQILLAFEYSPYWYFARMMLARTLDGQGEVAMALPDVKGNARGMVSEALAINAKSKNQLNAWNFIKLALSEHYQSNYQNFVLSLPVRLESLDAAVNQGVTTAQSLLLRLCNLVQAVTPDERQSYRDLVAGVAVCDIYNSYDVDTFQEEMQPYYRGERTLEECLAGLKKKFELYLSE